GVLGRGLGVVALNDCVDVRICGEQTFSDGTLDDTGSRNSASKDSEVECIANSTFREEASHDSPARHEDGGVLPCCSRIFDGAKRPVICCCLVADCLGKLRELEHDE